MEELYGFIEIDKDSVFEKQLKGRLLRIKRLYNASEIKPCIELMNRIWGFDERESIPLHEIVVCVMTGGLFLALELDGDIAGVVYVMPAWTAEHGFHHHSNFTGFKKEYRNMGLGLEAKRAHAIIAARQGVSLVTWTFDPLQAKNANLNFRKLGALSRTYLANLYGAMAGGFESGLPTDRLLLEWRLDTARVRERLSGKAPAPEELDLKYLCEPLVRVENRGMKILGTYKHGPSGTIRAAIPQGLHELFKNDPELARHKLAGFADLVTRLFRKGYTIVEMMPGCSEEEACYVFKKEFSW